MYNHIHKDVVGGGWYFFLYFFDDELGLSECGGNAKECGSFKLGFLSSDNSYSFFSMYVVCFFYA